MTSRQIGAIAVTGWALSTLLGYYAELTVYGIGHLGHISFRYAAEWGATSAVVATCTFRMRGSAARCLMGGLLGLSLAVSLYAWIFYVYAPPLDSQTLELVGIETIYLSLQGALVSLLIPGLARRATEFLWPRPGEHETRA